VIGASAYGGTALLRMLACMPWLLPMAYADRRMQTVALTEVAAIVRRAVEHELPAGADLDLVKAESHSLLEIVQALRHWMRQGPFLKVLRLPDWIGVAVSKIADALGYLGRRSPHRSTAL
jgi:hypothetical protein